MNRERNRADERENFEIPVRVTLLEGDVDGGENALEGLRQELHGTRNVLMGLFDSGSLKAHWRLVSKLSRTPDEWGMMLIIQAERFNILLENIEGVIISSVVPALNPILSRSGLGIAVVPRSI